MDIEKTIIGKYASKHGVASAVRKFKKNLKESTAREWRNYYNREMSRLQKEAKAVTVDSLLIKKGGKPPY